MANNQWFKGNKPTKVERFLHERMHTQAWELVNDWIARDLIPGDSDVDTLVDEIQDLVETGRSITM